MSTGILTNAGRDLFAQKAGAGEVLTIDRFLLANIAGLDPNSPADPDEALPDVAERVAELAVTKSGYVNNDKVVYSLYLGTGEGDYTFNWVGILSDDDTLVAVRYIEPISKYASGGGQVGNSITRNFLITYTDAQSITNITVDASTWQLSFDQATEDHAGLAKIADAQEAFDADDDQTFLTPKKSVNNKWLLKIFPNVDSMKSADWLQVGMRCRTLCYNTPGDNGGNDYEIVETDTGVDDGGRYIDLLTHQALGIFSSSSVPLETFGTGIGFDSGPMAKKALDFASAMGWDSSCSSPIQIDTAVNGDGSQRFRQRGNYTLSGSSGIFNVQLDIDKYTGTTERTWDRDSRGAYDTVGHIDRIINRSNGGYGRRLSYTQDADVENFSIAYGIISKSNGGGQSLAQWLVQATPQTDSLNFGVFCQEMNPINAAGDEGYSTRRGINARWTGGLQIVPEAKDLSRTGSTDCYNVLFGVVLAHSGSDNSLGQRVKTYNGLLVEPDAIAPLGVGAYFQGSSDGSNRPNYGVKIDGAWRHAIDTRGGVFDNNRAFRIGNNQFISFDNSDESLTLKVFGVNTQNSVVYGAAAPGGKHIFQSAGPNYTAFSVQSVVNSESYLQVTPSTGSSPQIAAESAQITDVDFLLRPKGQGKISFGVHNPISSETVTGYITIKDINGTERKLAVVS